MNMEKSIDRSGLRRVEDVIWEIPASFKDGMNVPARIYATQKLLESMDEGVFEQITNVACLPGIEQHALCMPDGHWGYGFPIGGVAAFDLEKGVISPGGIGFDINCGMRLITSTLTVEEVRPRLRELVDTLFGAIPAGVGTKGFVNLNSRQFKDVMRYGAEWCVDNGYGWKQDLERTEAGGRLEHADPSKVSDKAIQRGKDQLGTLGSGNHYLEVQVAHAGEIYDEEKARAFGIVNPGQIMLMVHCGSRGFGHQIGTDYLKVFGAAMRKYGITVNDRELACAPFRSPEGQDYFKAMACAANMAFANRQVILHRVREGFSRVFRRSAEHLGLEMIYDVAHNIAKIETYRVNGKEKRLLVHRKGATRAFGAGNPELGDAYRAAGQPVILGGSMETGSYLLAGTKHAEETTFGTTAHGSGRTMSRRQAKKQVNGRELLEKLERRGIYVRAASLSGVAEEAGNAYKHIDDVVETLDRAGISKKVVGLKPIGNIKG